MLETPQIIHTAPVHYACVHRKVPPAEIRQTMQTGVQVVMEGLAAQGRRPTGPLFTHHFVRPREMFDFEICFPVDSPVQPHGDVYTAVWPAMTVARAVYHGDYSGLPGAWGELEKWLAENHHHGRVDFWESYTVDPHAAPNPADWRTELIWPLC
jgi:effector-binding domain-containing protein